MIASSFNRRKVTPSNSRRLLLRVTPIYKVLLLATSALFVTFPARVVAQRKLKQLHVITRHGARTPLQKEAATLSEDDVGSTLTPLGQKQHYDLGLWLRDRYSETGWFDEYDPALAKFESSALDRTLVSANSLALGLFPPSARMGQQEADFSELLPVPPANIPVYSHSQKNDIYIRAYSNCNVFKQRLKDLYQNFEWKNIEENHEPLLRDLGNALPQFADPTRSIVPLENLWNAYDAVHVAKTECDDNPSSLTCLELPDPLIRNVVSEETWLELETAAHQAEYIKYGGEVAGSMLGSNLLWRILSRISSDGKFFHYSAHYPTILGMFSTLEEEPVSSVLPEYASALIFEVYEDLSQSTETVRIIYKEGNIDGVQSLSLRLCPALDDNFACPVPEMILWAEKNTLKTPEDWCSACGNTEADVCVAAALEGQCSLVNDLSQLVENGDRQAEMAVAGMFAIGMIFGMCAFALCNSCFCNRKSKRSIDQTPPTDLQSGDEDPSAEGAVLS